MMRLKLGAGCAGGERLHSFCIMPCIRFLASNGGHLPNLSILKQCGYYCDRSLAGGVGQLAFAMADLWWLAPLYVSTVHQPTNASVQRLAALQVCASDNSVMLCTPAGQSGVVAAQALMPHPSPCELSSFPHLLLPLLPITSVIRCKLHGKQTRSHHTNACTWQGLPAGVQSVPCFLLVSGSWTGRSPMAMKAQHGVQHCTT